MFEFPNSSAMDVASYIGGPSTFLPQIVTGQPEQIAAHSSSLLAKATQFMSLFTEFTRAAEQLSTVWSGAASESAVKKITTSLSSFEQIIKVIEGGAALLGVSGTMVQAAQTAYTSVVSAVNPTVASLISNWWTYSAGAALATSASASLRAFITSIEGMLTALGVGKLGAELATLATIITDVEQLFSKTQTASATGNTPTVGSLGSALTMPVSPASVATASGQQAITGYTPPALSGYTGTGTTGTGTGTTATGSTGSGYIGTPYSGSYPSTSGLTSGSYPSTGYDTAGAYPSTTTGYTTDPSDSWIATDPSATSTAAATPTTAPATGQDVSVTTTDNGITTTVEVPAGQAANINLDMTVNGTHLNESFAIGANGSVSVS